MLVTTSRDKKLRFWDVRQQKPAHEVAGHPGAKNSRCVWMGEHDRVATTGFSKMSERQLGLWDVRNPTKPVGGDFGFLDSSSGVGMPFWDDGCQMLYIGGKGDGNIRYYEYENDKFESLSEHKSPEPQRGLAFMPKRGVNTHDNELVRAFKTVNDTYIEPISFIVPRRSENFQEDIYPPTVGTKAAMSSGGWLDGKTGLPPKWSMEDLYEGNEPTEIAAEDAPKPTATRSAPEPAPAPAPSKPEPVVEKPEPTPTTAPETSAVNENKQSMSDMASKFADKDDEPGDDEESSSSFEEVQKPVERPSAVKKDVAEPTSIPPAGSPSQPQPQPAGDSVMGETVSSPPTAEHAKTMEEPAATPAPSASAAAGGLRDVLQEIRGMLQNQGKQIEQLTSEVAQLKEKVAE